MRLPHEGIPPCALPQQPLHPLPPLLPFLLPLPAYRLPVVIPTDCLILCVQHFGAVVEHWRDHQLHLLFPSGHRQPLVPAHPLPLPQVYLLLPRYQRVECPHPRQRVHIQARLSCARPQRRPRAAVELQPAVFVLEQPVLEIHILVAEVGDGHQQKGRHHPSRHHNVLPRPDVFHDHPLRRDQRPQLTPPRLRLVERALLLSGSERGLRALEVLDELVVGVAEEEVVVDEGLARHDAEEVHEALRRVANDAADAVSAGAGVEDGEVDVGVGVGGVVEAAAGDGIGGAPQLEDAVDVGEVGEEAAVLVIALASAGGTEDGDEGGQIGIYLVQLLSEERPRGLEERR
ncbi:hypothetical protein MUK42_09799 [Musa troglodytarum]|uniref:Uncharacterized protein n=1 Tax=Musa troglodytarum TaxID=320322 RepID=A0A9E7JAG2_9LILI|nr:hypothetical protein MUK42_09799 [Musa troglodytarum]